MRSKYQMFSASLEPGKAKEVDLQDFSFVAKSGGVCASRRGPRPPVTFYLFAAATKFNLQPIQPQGLHLENYHCLEVR